MRKVYLDYAATTPVAPEVKKAMEPYWSKIFGNPAAMHRFGQDARKAIEEARENVASFFNVDQEEIIFTSGATESNNLALRGVVKGIKDYVEKYRDRVNIQSDKVQSKNKVQSTKYKVPSFVPHIVTTPFEHHCLLDTAKDLLKGEAEVTFIKVGRDGVVDPKEISKAIKPNTVVISVMYVNNEIGTIAPVKKIGELIGKEKIRRKEKAGLSGKEALPIYFHSDITQTVNYLPCNMKKIGVDLFSLSAHKIYGPKGIGALGVGKSVKIEKIQFGGSQEFDLRAGTHNVTGIVGMGAAINRMENGKWKMENIGKVKRLRDYFWEKLRKEVKDIKLNGSMEKRVANNLNVSIAGVEGESMLLALDMAGVACSTGSACSSETLEPSHVLLSIGLTHPEAHGSLRFTLGEGTTKADVNYATLQVRSVVEKLRRVSGFSR
jgi:cysteine desulfurase